MTALAGVGFALTVPASWYEIELRPGLREPAIRSLVDARVRDVPQLRDHRSAIAKLLRAVAGQAWDSGARYAAGLVEPTADGPLTASVTVTTLPAPPHGPGHHPDDGDSLTVLLDRLTVRPLPPGSDPTTRAWTEVGTVDLGETGQAARVHGVEDVDAPGGAGPVRVALMQTFVPVLGRNAVLLISCSSPVVALAETWFDLFDAITGTFRVVEADQ